MLQAPRLSLPAPGNLSLTGKFCLRPDTWVNKRELLEAISARGTRMLPTPSKAIKSPCKKPSQNWSTPHLNPNQRPSSHLAAAHLGASCGKTGETKVRSLGSSAELISEKIFARQEHVVLKDALTQKSKTVQEPATRN